MNINKIKAVIITIVIQLILTLIFFIGGLLDPLLAIYICGFYFFGIGSFLLYKTILNKLTK